MVGNLGRSWRRAARRLHAAPLIRAYGQDEPLDVHLFELTTFWGGV